MRGNGDDRASKIDLKDLAERCRVASNAVEMLPSDSKLFAECASVFDSTAKLIETLPEMVRKNREHQYAVTCVGVAEALEKFAVDYEVGTRETEAPQGALRTFAASLRESLRPKSPPTQKPTLVL